MLGIRKNGECAGYLVNMHNAPVPHFAKASSEPATLDLHRCGASANVEEEGTVTQMEVSDQTRRDQT